MALKSPAQYVDNHRDGRAAAPTIANNASDYNHDDAERDGI